MLAVGDALALVVSQMRGFGREDFARLHPAGSLGRKLSKVEHHMRPLAQCRVANQRQTIREVLIGASMPGRRTGATMLVNEDGKLAGIFTDSDLARLFEHRRDGELDSPICEVMTRSPLRVEIGSMMVDAVTIMAQRKISELPVVNVSGKPVGLIDITDVVGVLPREAAGDEAVSGALFPTADLAHRGSTPGRTKCLVMDVDLRCRSVQLILSDVDGVLTDGGITFNNQGIETKRFHVRDGMGIRLWQKAGYRFGLVTHRSSNIVKTRVAELGIEIIRQGIDDKLTAMRGILAELRLSPAQVCYIGDDLPDLRSRASGRLWRRGGRRLRGTSPGGPLCHHVAGRIGGGSRNDRVDSPGPIPLGGPDPSIP